MYSQSAEEQYILEHCPADGRFLEIGAWHPRQFSNTRALYERGWSGVMIEPSPVPMHVLLQEYGNDPRITLVEAAVGLDTHLIKLHVTQDALSTSNPNNLRRWGEEGGFYGSMLVPQITIHQVLAQFGGQFDFISIDTEGGSVELLRELLATPHNPHCICFEHDRRFSESFAYIEKAGYRIVYENDDNRVIVRGK